MSSYPDSNRATTIQNLAHTIMQEFDVTLGSQFSYDEFANFLDGFAETIGGQQATPAANARVPIAAFTSAVPTGSPGCAAAGNPHRLDLCGPGERQ
jgi:hypothetical protein